MSVAVTSPERRKAPRMLAERIACLNFDEHNGGIILNVSEGGLCFHSIVPVREADTVRFWLGERGERVEGEGRLIWTDDSHKRGGLCFVNMSAEACDKLFDVISEPATPVAPVVTGRFPKGRAMEPRQRGPLRIRIPSAQVIRFFRGFSGGLASGLVISALIAGAFLSHRQLGEFLVRLGEHLGANPAVPTDAAVRTHTEPAAPMQKQAVPRGPLPTERRKSAVPAAVLADPIDRLPKPAADVKVSVSNSASAKPPVMADDAVTLPPPPIIALPKALIPTAPAVFPERSIPPPTSHTLVETKSSRPVASDEIDQMYFEVGKFKQRFGAKEETDKLATLGFPATVLQKGRLWMDSYHVLVGPYRESAEAESVYRDLVAHGFEARPFERGSRNLVLPAQLTWHGVQVPVGECVIKWESYIRDVRVKFEQNKHVVATAEGKWVSRDPKYERSAIAYIKRGDGLRTLVELQFEGMSRTLIFKK